MSEQGNQGAPSKGALTEAELRALVAEAARKGGKALAAVAALVGVILLVALVAVPHWQHEQASGQQALTAAQEAPYGNQAP